MGQFTIKLPISVEIGAKKKRKHYLNLNLFRNLHHHTNNNIKKEYKRLIEPLLPDVHYGLWEVEYELFLPNKLKRDINNVCSVIDKNFCDAFVELGHAEDDNYEFLKKVTYMYGGMDENRKGYVLVTVKEVD